MIRACLRQRCLPYVNVTGPWHHSRKSLATVANGVRNLQPDHVSSIRNEKRHDDRVLRSLFDSASFWQNYNSPSLQETQRPSGLFQNHYLTEPGGFPRFAQDIKVKCQELVSHVVQATSFQEYQAIPRQLDLLSDCLCRVMDTADFVRANHPDIQFQQQATVAYTHLWEYMNVLNTTPGLKTSLQRALSDPEISSSWNEEEVSVAQNLLRDFSISAIDLPEKSRRHFVELSNKTKQLGNDFVDKIGPADAYVQLKGQEALGMDPTLLKRYKSRFGGISLPIDSNVAYSALGSVRDERARQKIYSSMRTVSKTQLETLEQLLITRSEIARLSAFNSYAAMNLSDKMAKTPEAVDSFLVALCADNAPQVQEEVKKLENLKKVEGLNAPCQPWDVFYYQHRLNSSLQKAPRSPRDLSAFFSLGTVMQGLSRLFDRLYGIQLIPCQTKPGETWESNVRRLNVVHEDEGHVAVLYCDLFERAGKSPNPAHFTLRCSRQISPAEIADTSWASDDGMARATSRHTGQVHQLPTITLTCDFSFPSDSKAPCLLSFRDVQTLFHEMGHAIHSILGRTSLQVVSGTRCATDFAEIPSVLMESFAADRSVLGLFARHWQDDTKLPYEMVQDVLETQQRGRGTLTETQILYSLLDQAYHSSLPSLSGFDSTKTFYDVYDGYGSLREPRGLSPQGLFSHLVEYGGTYYSYLFDRVIAGKIWRQVFKGGQNGGGIDRESGEKFRNEVLKWGGGRDAWKCVGGVLDNEKLVKGGEGAMEEVGRWGVND